MTIAEIALTPDERFILVTNREDKSVDGADSLATWELGAGGKGELKFRGLASVGGSFPRHFAINKKGDLVAVGLQKSAKVTVLKRDVGSGEVAGVVAECVVEGEVTCVIWDE